MHQSSLLILGFEFSNPILDCGGVLDDTYDYVFIIILANLFSQSFMGCGKLCL